MIVMTLIYLALLGLLALSARTKYYLYAKTASSLGFVAIAFIGSITHHAIYTYILMLPGLVGFMTGDIVLAFKSRNSMRYGIVAFAIGDLGFLYFLSAYHSFGLSQFCFSFILLGILYLIIKKKLINFGDLTPLVAIYTFLEGIVVSKAYLVYSNVPTTFMFLIFLGLTLYFISDIVLMIFKFKNQALAIGAIALGLYYGGLYLLAISFYYI